MSALGLDCMKTRFMKHEPVHERGVVTGEPGLYFVGLEFLYSMASGMVQGVGRHARHIADQIVSIMNA